MMEIAAGDDHKALRKIAAALLAKAGDGDGPAINSLADRTDGKVAPSSDQVRIGLKDGKPVARAGGMFIRAALVHSMTHEKRRRPRPTSSQLPHASDKKRMPRKARRSRLA